MSERVEVLEIDLTDVQQEAAQTGKTLKELRKEVKDLRTQLENTEMGTADFTSTLDQLIKKQQELTNVTKSGVKAQTGSYNDLVNQMALLKKEWRAAADESERAAIGQKIGVINARLKELDASLGNYQRNVGNYQGEMHELATDLDAVCGAASSAAPKIDSYNSEVKGLSESTESLNTTSTDWVKTAENSVKVTAGITGAFQAAQGAINLMGIESEATTQMIAQMQNVMAITEGLKAISEGIESFSQLKNSVEGASIMAKIFGTETKAMTVATNAQTVATTGATVATNAFKKALIATGIGAIVVLIGTLIAKWEDLKEALGFATKEQEEYNKAAEEQKRIETERRNAVNSSVADVISKYKLLQAEWQTLKTQQEKTDWIRDNADAFSDLGLAITDVTSAQDVLIDKAGLVIKALTLQAEATALQEIYQEAYKEAYLHAKDLEDQMTELQKKSYVGYDTDSDFREKYNVEKGRGFSTQNHGYFQKNTRQEWSRQLGDYMTITTVSDRLNEAGAAYVKGQMIDALQDQIDAVYNDANEILADVQAKQKEADEAAVEAAKYVTTTKRGSGSGRSGGSSTTSTNTNTGESEEEKWLKAKEDFAKERLRVLEELNQVEFDALQTQRESQFDKEVAQLEREKEEQLAVLTEYLNTKIKNEKTGEEYSLINQAEYDKASLELEKIYSEKIAEVEKARAEEQKRVMVERIDGINKKLQDAIQVANNQYEIHSAVASAAGDEVTNARALQTLLDAQNQALTTQRDELLAYKAELQELGQDLTVINAELEANSNAMALNAHNQTMAIAAEKAAQLELINDIVGSVSDSMDQLLALDLGSKWSDELGIAFSAIQNGIAQTSEALKSGQKGWQAYGQMAAAGLNAAAGILNSIAEKQDEESKDGFEKQKKLQIAAATMSMLAGVVSAITSAFNPANSWMTIWGQAAAAAAMSALVITTGAIQIANIKKQTLDNASGGGETPSIPSITAMNAIANPVQTTTTVEGASTEANVQDTKVYVLESDITSTQNNVKSTVAEATF